MAIEPIWEGDTLIIDVTVTDSAGSAKDLSGATIVAKAAHGSTTVVGTATVTDASAGQFKISFGAGDLTKGTCSVQSRVSYGSSPVNTVLDDTVTVNESIL